MSDKPIAPHRLDWSSYKGIARCTQCSWTAVTWTYPAARAAHAAAHLDSLEATS
jgi:hypothetical protein